MSHEIEEHDRVFSVEGTEWHGLAEQVELIDRETASPILFPIRESVGAKFVLDDGTEISGIGSKGIFADLRSRNDARLPEGMLQLSTMGEGYGVIENGAIWDAMANAFAGTGVKHHVTTAGTLGNCGKFFVSVALTGEEKFKVNGDEFAAYINFITSHNGALSCMAYDSFIRIVCMNTLRWSMEAAHAAQFYVKHTKNASVQLENLSKFLAEIFAGRDVFKATVERLAGMPCSLSEAENFIKGYLARVNNVKKGMELSTRSKNVGIELVSLFQAGQGNKGVTMNDLLNAGTECWTSGTGTGKNATKEVKVCKSAFGAAADHKDQWFKALADDQTRADLTELGKGFVSLYQ